MGLLLAFRVSANCQRMRDGRLTLPVELQVCPAVLDANPLAPRDVFLTSVFISV